MSYWKQRRLRRWKRIAQYDRRKERLIRKIIFMELLANGR